MSSDSGLSIEHGLAYCQSVVRSVKFNETVRVLNIFVSMLFIFVGLIGNSLGVYVFVQKRFRNHSSSIYLLFLCLSDGLFLLMHFFEDTLRTFIDVFLNADTSSYDPVTAACVNMTNYTNPFKLIATTAANGNALAETSSLESALRSINITDRFNVTCRIVNFLRYFLRFVSAYVIIAFTVQVWVHIKYQIAAFLKGSIMKGLKISNFLPRF
jgi:hypothetical protein